MNTTLLVLLDGIYKRVDLYEDIPISVVIQQADITALDTRKSPYSKQFVVPNTNNNAIVFEHYFEVNGIEFNPLTKIQCVVQYRGVDIFNGLLRLSAVIENSTHTDFEVYIMGVVGDFASEIRNITLQDLQWDDLQHELNYTSITTSWSADTTDTNGLFGGKILYPMINYGLPYFTSTGATSAATPVFTYSFDETRSFTQATCPIPESIWKPSVRIKEVINRIFARTEYTVLSEFFETDYFRSIYMDTFQNGKLGVEVASAVTNQNLFRIYTNPTWGWKGNQIPVGQKDFLIQRFGGDGYDPLDNITEAVPYNSIDPGNQPTKAFFRVPFGGQYGFNVRFNYDDFGICGGQIKFQVILRKARTIAELPTGTVIHSSDEFELPTCGLQASVNYFPTVPLDAGDYVKVFIQINENDNLKPGLRLLPYNSFGLKNQAPFWDCYSSPTLAGTQIVDLRLGLQQTNCIDFIKALVTMFNLVIIQNEADKTITMEPWNWVYNESERVERDWTQRLDLNSSYRVEPFTFELPKELNFQYERGSEEFLNKVFEDRNAYTFGRLKYISSNNLLTEEVSYEIPFAATPTSGVTNGANVIIPMVYRDLNGQQSPYSNKPHLFFWTGNRYLYQDQNKTIQSEWYLSSGNTQFSQTTYPCVSHLSSLDIQIPSLVSDLNFGSTFDFFGNSNVLPVQYTPFTLYNLNWEDYINNNYSNETRRLTGKFFLRPTDLYEVNLTDKIFVKDSFYRIEVINEGSLIDEKLTEISLIKERGGYYKVEPPAPYYAIEPNQPYPGFLTSYTATTYTGATRGPVCAGTAVVGNVITFGVTGFANLQQVYYDAGTAYIPLPIGTFLRETTDTITYIVINNVGQILQIDC